MLKVTETAKKRTVLGQGLNALIPMDDFVPNTDSAQHIRSVSIDDLIPNPHQPRSLFSEESLMDLSKSIKEMGVIQPLIVRPAVDQKYEIVAGERRWRAAMLAGFPTVPVIVRRLTDVESLEIALIENLQREDLNPVDTAEAYDILIRKFSYTHENLAQRIGKDRTSITNHLRLLKLPDPIKKHLRDELISMGHARTLLALDHAPMQLNLSNRVIRRKLSVRELEKIVQNYKNQQDSKVPKNRISDPALATLETRLSRHFSTRVTIKQNPNEIGKLEIHFHSKEELDRLLELMGYSEDFS
ncbi:MAG: ParB/RepB/Spo0J family partition protein [Desulfomonilaceae bacterium]